MPPSTASVAPVTNELSSLARNSMARATSGAWYLVIVGGLAVITTLVSPRGLWGFAADRFGWSLLPGASAARMTANRPRG